MRYFKSRTVAIGVIALLSAFPAAASADPPDQPRFATFEGGTIAMPAAVALELSCNVTDDDLSCYRTEQEASTALTGGSFGALVALASCSPPMTLYNGTSFTGASLNISTQSTWINLSGLGFDNITSSWKTGCAGGYLANGTGGGGSTIGMAANNSQSSLGAFNNLASSAKRCPC